ncbi:thylakoid lumenal 16.5 kDa protein, chloroplastic [Typha angustifolia]|uniref:thylakoid lumenal 16.5 kDa protein, chloroplastic n=1 Tax=Typha angustifolia TaxID=59011 RepID=UPI003C300902
MVSALTAPLARAVASCPAPPPPKASSPPAAVSVVPLPHHHSAVGRRHGFSACLLTALVLSSSSAARAAILEADDDEELLERVKQDRKKRLERQGVISSSGKETGYLQELVYKLSKVGQAIENNDLSAASSALGSNTNAEWVQNVNTAFMKLSSSPEEKVEMEAFNSSLVSLFTSVAKRDFESSKAAFVSSASALEKWIGLTGLVGQLKGL